METTIRKIFRDLDSYSNQTVTISGFVRNNRSQKEFGFIDLSDGSFFNTIQVVYESNLGNFSEIQKYRVGSSMEVTGTIVPTPGAKQPFELKATAVTLLGMAQEDYPIQPKRHSREFLREVAHLRPRTNLFSAVFRTRSTIAYAVHKFFQEQNFVYVNTPIITTNDGEGAGEMFRVTTLDMNNLPLTDEGKVDNKEDFFTKEALLTVTGQLHVEPYAQAFRDVYTFGPTFRSEKSNTKKHGAEFWMIEPEISFADLDDVMDLMESMVKYLIKYALDNLPEEMQFFDSFVEKGLIERLTKVLNSNFTRVSHHDAITILKNSGIKFENEPEYGEDLASEHEKAIVDHFGGPVFVKDWPKDIKAFYMRMNDDNETVAAVDLLVPGSGELCGGSQREERLDLLIKRMDDLGMTKETLDWYLDTRRYGTNKHAGFGMGFERMIMYLTGVDNIRDVIPYPRTSKNCEF